MKTKQKDNILKMQKSSDETGALLLEMLAVLAIMAMMFPLVAKQDSIRRQETSNINIANQARRIIEATDNMVKDRYSDLLTSSSLSGIDCTTGLAVAIATNPLNVSSNINHFSVDDLKTLGYLPCSMIDGNKYDQTYKIAMKAIQIPPAAAGKYRIDAMVVTQDGDAIPEKYASQIAEFLGAKGGYTSTTFNSGDTSGTGGGWTMDVSTEFSSVPLSLTINEDPGHISAFASSYVEAANSSLYDPSVLYRDTVAGFPDANTMKVDLDMGGNNITNAGDITASGTITAGTATVSGTLTATSIDIANLLKAASIETTGAIDAGGLITATSGLTISAGGLTISSGDITATSSDVYVQSLTASGDITVTGAGSTIHASGANSTIEAASASASIYNDTSAETWVFNDGYKDVSYYMDPSSTSLMNDIKLASRGGARLSEILPNYILKEVQYYENISQYGSKPLFDDAPLYDSTSAYWGGTRFAGQTYNYTNDGSQAEDESAVYPCPNDYDSTLPYYKDPDTGACGAETPIAPNCGTPWTDSQIENCLSGPLLGGTYIPYPTCPDNYVPIISVMPVKWNSAEARYCHYGDTDADCVALALESGDPPVFMSQDSGSIYVTAKDYDSDSSGTADSWQIFMGQIYPQAISDPLTPAGTYIWNSPDDDPANATVKQREMGAVVNIYCYFDESVYGTGGIPSIPSP